MSCTCTCTPPFQGTRGSKGDRVDMVLRTSHIPAPLSACRRERVDMENAWVPPAGRPGERLAYARSWGKRRFPDEPIAYTGRRPAGAGQGKKTLELAC